MSSEAIKKFLDGFSVEVTPKAASKIENFEDYIPSGTLVYIAHIEGTPIEEMVETAKKINDQGFCAMPHFPARIIKDKNVLEDWISRYKNEANVSNALLIAGGANKPYGEYDSSIQLIESELFDKQILIIFISLDILKAAWILILMDQQPMLIKRCLGKMNLVSGLMQIWQLLHSLVLMQVL